MAIQVRRGNYADLDTSKLVQGEPFVTLDEVDGDYYVGMAIAPSNVVRLATWDDLTDIRTDCVQAKDDAEAAATSAEQDASNAEAWAVGQRNGSDVPSTDPTYENNSKYYAEQAGTAWTNIDNAIDQVVPIITMNWTDGKLYYDGSSLGFYIDPTTGKLCWEVIV